MKYALLTTKARMSLTEYKDFDIPIIGHDTLYNAAPLPGVPMVPIRTGRTEGYDSIDLFWLDICNYLGFNPFKMKEFEINTRGTETKVPDVIHAFMGEYTVSNVNHGNFYPERDPQTGGNDTGTTWLADGYSGRQATYSNTPYGSGSTYDYNFHNIVIPYQETTADDGIDCEFEIWPERCISSGYIDIQHLNTDNGLYRVVHLIMHIYYDETTAKYNYALYLESGNPTQARCDYMRTVLNSAELKHVYDPDNPGDNKQDEGDEGGNGDFNNDDDTVPVPDLPSIDITTAGGLNLYRLSNTDYRDLMAYLGSNDPGQAIVKWFTNPIQAISACYMLPYPVSVTGSSEITVLGMHTGIAAYTAKQWTKYELGSVYIPQGFGDCFLDYSPWSRVSLFLPFIGVKHLNADDVIQKTIGITYHFDNISGACTAYVTSNGNLRYTFSGSCAVGIPISQSNWGQTYIAAATAAAGAIAGGVGAAGAAMADGASMAGIVGNGIMGAVNGGGGLSAFNSKPTITRSGSVCGAGAAIGLNQPVLFIERPDKAKIMDPKNVIGITSGRTLSLGSLSGYNSIEHVHLHGIAATGPELEEIEKLLYEGVIF